MKIFIDESGDLGFSSGSSKWFVITMLLTSHHRKVEKCLQAIDFVSWAIFRKYERGDYDYYNLIQEKIVSENFLFK